MCVLRWISSAGERQGTNSCNSCTFRSEEAIGDRCRCRATKPQLIPAIRNTQSTEEIESSHSSARIYVSTHCAAEIQRRVDEAIATVRRTFEARQRALGARCERRVHTGASGHRQARPAPHQRRIKHRGHARRGVIRPPDSRAPGDRRRTRAVRPPCNRWRAARRRPRRSRARRSRSRFRPACACSRRKHGRRRLGFRCRRDGGQRYTRPSRPRARRGHRRGLRTCLSRAENWSPGSPWVGSEDVGAVFMTTILE